MTRTLAEIRADLAAVHERHGALLAELTHVEASVGALPVPPADDGPIVSLKEAARRTGWKVERVKAHLMRHRLAHPHDLPIGYQPGDVRNAPWCVRLALFEASIVGQKHQRTTTSTN